MQLSRRLLLQIAALAAVSPSALAQPKYPARPVRVLVPFPPGGAVDVVAPPSSQKLSERLGHQFCVRTSAGRAATSVRARPRGPRRTDTRF